MLSLKPDKWLLRQAPTDRLDLAFTIGLGFLAGAVIVVQAGAGVWAPTAGQAATAVRELLSAGNPRLAQMAARARALAQPDAARRVAESVWAIAGGELA